MNKIAVNISSFAMFLIALFFSGTTVLGNNTSGALSENVIRWRINNMVGPIDYRYTSKVKSEVEAYTFRYRKGAEELLGRATIYFPIFEQKIKEKNLPKELKYLSLIESALKVNAYSKVGAAGLWQFMRGTAREYGLTVNKSYDQRYSVEESTDAALEYLSRLYDQFGDWTMALAAYNCGPGNVRKAMRRSGHNDYWSIRSYLPKETRDYIPRLVAATYLVNYFYEHELVPVKQDNYYFQTAESIVYRHLSFREISRLTNTSIDIIKNLNSSFRKNFIPANTRGFKLILPQQAMYSLIQSDKTGKIQLLTLNEINYNQYIRMNFKPEIARYLLSESQVQYSIVQSPVIGVQQYTIQSKDWSINSNHPGTNNVGAFRRKLNHKDFSYYRLKNGESLKDVVRKFPKTSIEAIIRMNSIRIAFPPTPGTLIKVAKK